MYCPIKYGITRLLARVLPSMNSPAAKHTFEIGRDAAQLDGHGSVFWEHSTRIFGEDGRKELHALP
jgi:hypothetical protein